MRGMLQYGPMMPPIWRGAGFRGAGFAGRAPAPHLRVQDIQIFQSGAGVEEDYCVFWLEESMVAEFAVGDQAGCAFGGGEDAFGFGPVAGGFEDFFVGGADGGAFALFQDVEDQVVAVGLRARAGLRLWSRRWATFLRMCLPSSQAFTIGAQPAACTVIIFGRSEPIQPRASISSKAFHMPIRPTPPPVG